MTRYLGKINFHPATVHLHSCGGHGSVQQNGRRGYAGTKTFLRMNTSLMK